MAFAMAKKYATRGYPEPVVEPIFKSPTIRKSHSSLNSSMKTPRSTSKGRSTGRSGRKTPKGSLNKGGPSAAARTFPQVISSAGLSPKKKHTRPLAAGYKLQGPVNSKNERKKWADLTGTTNRDHPLGHQELPTSPAPKGLDLRRARAEKAERTKSCKILRQIENLLPLGEGDQEKAFLEHMYEQATTGHIGEMTMNEMDRFIRDTLKCHALFNCRPVLEKAISASRVKRKRKKLGRGEDLISFQEFRFCLLYVRRYFELWLMFQLIDKNGDRCVSLEEFVAAVPFLQHWGSKITEEEAQDIFLAADSDGGGYVLFDEFSTWAMAQGIRMTRITLITRTHTYPPLSLSWSISRIFLSYVLCIYINFCYYDVSCLLSYHICIYSFKMMKYLWNIYIYI